MKDCGIVKDLLPLVAEHMASEESTAFVEEHLKTCADCKAAFEAMQAPVETEPAAPLKTVRRGVKKRGLLLAGLIACLVAALFFGVFTRLKKVIPVTSADAAFESIEIDGGIQYEMHGNDIYMKNIEVDPETGEAFFIADDGERISLRDLTVHGSDGGFRLETDGEKLLGKLVLKANPSVDGIMIHGINGEQFVTAYTTLWREWFERGKEAIVAQIPLYGVDAVFFEPYNNTDREVLYQREGYTPEAGFALPRLVLNYYFLIAAIGTAILAVVWLVLRLCKKRKASRVLGLLLILAGSFVLAFLAAGFPATTIAPVRELAFVLLIALLLIGAGLCGRALLRKD
ncbi:MAG: zf-HC2 domain-containing protein [Clostridia bacterium]|nr:zf-HC2 domain-containing protein [Clostridia bacterium]